METESSSTFPKFDLHLNDQLFAYENETRWIFAWDSWIKLLKLKLFHDAPLTETSTMDINDVGALEETIQNFQASYETGKTTNSSEHTYELVLALKMWKEVHWQTISVLSYADQLFSEKNDAYKNLPMAQKVDIEVNKKRVAESVTISSKKVEKYRSQLNSAAAQLKIQHRLNPRMDVSSLMTVVFQALFQKNDLETKYTDDCVKKIITALFKDEGITSYRKSSKYLNIPEFYKPLFVGRSDYEEITPSGLQAKVDYILEILQTGTEWYIGWTTFTEEILVEINATLPENISRAPLYENTVTNGQLALLKGLIMEVKTISDRNNKSILISFLSVLDCFINLLEKAKEESEFWIQNLDRFLTELGEDDVNNVPMGDRINHKLFILKCTLQDKNRQIHISVLYLYKEFNHVIDLVKTEFAQSDEEYATLESITSSLLDQYTENRKEKMGPVPLPKNNTVYDNFENLETEDNETSPGLSPEILMKMSLDKYPCEENFWSDSMTFGLDKNKEEDANKMENVASDASFDEKIAEEQEGVNNPQNTLKLNSSKFIDGTEDTDDLYGSGISPGIQALVQDINKKINTADLLEDLSPSGESQKERSIPE